MLARKPYAVQFVGALAGICLLLLAFSLPVTVHADEPDNGTCISCHEDLYLLHDTGNWYCLNESPMTCVECHGGDSNATVKESAHTNRAPHPILNEDISKCQECHPNECGERVELFKKTAGISEVFVAAPYTPSHSSAEIIGAPTASQEPDNARLGFMEFLPVLLLVSLALLTYKWYQSRRFFKSKP